MRKLILVCFTIAACAAVSSLQAADQCPMSKSSCCDQSKATCSASKSTKTTQTTANKSCCGAAKVAKKHVDVKGATLLVQR